MQGIRFVGPIFHEKARPYHLPSHAYRHEPLARGSSLFRPRRCRTCNSRPTWMASPRSSVTQRSDERHCVDGLDKPGASRILVQRKESGVLSDSLLVSGRIKEDIRQDWQERKVDRDRRGLGAKRPCARYPITVAGRTGRHSGAGWLNTRDSRCHGYEQ